MLKRVCMLFLVFLMIPQMIFATQNQENRPTYLKVSVDNKNPEESNTIVLSWKNSNDVVQRIQKGEKVTYEIDVKKNENPWHSEGKLGTLQNEVKVDGNGKTTVVLNENHFAAIREFNIFESHYSFRVRYKIGGNSGPFSTYVTIGLKPTYKNYSPWAAEEISKANSMGIIPVKAKENLKEKITREEFVEACVRGYEKSKGTVTAQPANKFKDTTNPWMLKGAALNIIKGDGTGKANPTNPLTREEMAIMIGNVLKAKGRKVEGVQPKVFKDQKSISPWAKDAVSSLGGMGIVKGDQSGKFRPKDLVTREEGIVLVLRSMDF